MEPHFRVYILDMLEPHIASIQQCQCGSNICNIKGDMIKKVGAAMLEYLPILSHDHCT